MNEVSIIINEKRFDAVNEERPLSCKGCDIKKKSHQQPIVDWLHYANGEI